MKLATTTLAFLLFSPVILAAEDEPKKTPRLHESLKEMAWLVGEWQHTSEYLSGDSRDGLVLRPVSVAPSEEGRALTVKYQFAFVDKSGLGPHTFGCREVLRYDGERKCYVVTYTTEFAGGNFIDAGGAGTGQYVLKEAQGNKWGGDASFVDMRRPTQTCTYKIVLTKVDNDHLTLHLTDRRGYLVFQGDMTVELRRSEPAESRTTK
jgi:hypothetical protein